MWSDRFTKQMQESNTEFEHVGADGLIIGKYNLDKAVEIAEKSGLADARFTLECAYSDELCVDLPDGTMLIPEPWSE